MLRVSNRGQFQKGQSGNPKGRPPRTDVQTSRRLDSADPSPTAMSTPGTATSALARRAQPAIRRDRWENSASGHGTSRDRRTLTRYSVDIVTDIEATQLRRSEFLAAAIIEQGPKEALKRPWSLKCEDKELANAIEKQAESLGLDDILYEAWTKENEAGGSAIFPVLSGALGDLSAPLDLQGVASVDAFHVFEPQELTPVAYYSDIRHPKFLRPAAYRLTPLNSGRGGYIPMQVIHESRLVIFPGTRVSRQTQPGQREGWGDSKLCRPMSVIADFGLAWGSAATLLHQHGKETLEMDGLAHMLSQSDGLAEFDNHVAAMQLAWSTLRMNVIDNKSRISRSTGTLAGVADTLSKFESLMAAAAERPVSILMGVGSTGLRTGDDDTRSWYSAVERDRSKHLKPRHEQLVRLMLLATSGPANGKEPEAWSVEYPPLWSPSEKEVAETRKTDMDRAVAAVNAGIASADDVAESFYKGDTYSGDIVINWERREAQAKIDEERAETLSGEDREALGFEGEEFDLSDEELDELEEFDDDEDDEWDLDDEEDEERDDSLDEIRLDKGGGGKGRSAGGVRKSGSGKGYNPYRSSDGRFGAGAHKKEPKASGKAAVAKAAKPKAAKFDPTSHKTAIGTHKATETKHRSESLRLKGEMAAVKAQAAKLPAKQRGELKAQHAALSAQRKEQQTKANEAKVARIAASKEMTAARKEHTAKAKAERENATPAAAPKNDTPAPTAAPNKPAEAPQTSAKPVSDTDLDAARMRFARSGTQEEFAEVGNYRGMYFGSVNRTLRGVPTDRDLREKALVDGTVKGLDSIMAKNRTPTDIVTYRGTEAHPSFANLKPGEIYVDKAYQSTSTQKEAAMGGDYMFHITSPKGTKIGAITADETGYTGAWGGEKEMLLARGSALRLERRETTKDQGYEQTVLHFTVVGQPD
jgi:uncharacterized protein